jgi:hypothetical protein
MNLDKNNLIHPSDIAGEFRKLRWTDLPLKVKIELELIDYFNPKMFTYAKGAYMNIAAKSLQNNTNAQLIQNETFIVQFSYKTFVNAMFALPYDMKRYCSRESMNDGDNLYIKFEKVKDKHMVIHNIERRNPDDELLVKAKKMYKILEVLE